MDLNTKLIGQYWASVHGLADYYFPAGTKLRPLHVIVAGASKIDILQIHDKMKKIKLTLLILNLFILTQTNIYAQANSEKQIRKLENQEKEAVLKGDTTTLYKLWSPNYVVNAPMNAVATYNELKGFLREGQIDYTSFDRIIEKITFTGEIAIVMGKEITTPEKNTENAGKTVTRRYTNIWMKTKGIWLLTARQATNIVVE